jgi:hypothetical protein
MEGQMTTKGNIEWEYWRKHNEKDAGGKPYTAQGKLYQPPEGHTGACGRKTSAIIMLNRSRKRADGCLVA